MTNLEWLKSLNADDFAEWTGIVASGDVYDDADSLKNFTTWCHDGGCRVGNCDSCIKKWLETERVVPMPALENGMFVNVGIFNCVSQNGVVVGDNIIYQNGLCDPIDKVKDKIVKVYSAKCFNECLESHVVWKRL